MPSAFSAKRRVFSHGYTQIRIRVYLCSSVAVFRLVVDLAKDLFGEQWERIFSKIHYDDEGGRHGGACLLLWGRADGTAERACYFGDGRTARRSVPATLGTARRSVPATLGRLKYGENVGVALFRGPFFQRLVLKLHGRIGAGCEE